MNARNRDIKRLRKRVLKLHEKSRYLPFEQKIRTVKTITAINEIIGSKVTDFIEDQKTFIKNLKSATDDILSK